MKTKRLFFIVLMAIFIGQANAQIISTEQETQTNELPGIEPEKNKIPIDIIPIAGDDVITRNVILSGYIRGGGSGHALTVNTGNGIIDIGAQNSSWAHIYSDRPNFIFNKPVYTANGVFSSYNTSNLYLRTNTTNRLTILNSNGYVGIGTTTPENRLEVYGGAGIVVGGQYKKFMIHTQDWDPTSHRLMIFAKNNGSWDFAHQFEFWDNGKFSAPYIGIGTTNTLSYRLAVNGGILCESVKVIGDVPASDYVFESNYELPDLKDLEQFVKEHKHLPEVPSAKEFKENGYSLGEMDNLLLKKIEELTLYIIEQDKKMKELEKEVKALKTPITKK